METALNSPCHNPEGRARLPRCPPRRRGDAGGLPLLPGGAAEGTLRAAVEIAPQGHSMAGSAVAGAQMEGGVGGAGLGAGLGARGTTPAARLPGKLGCDLLPTVPRDEKSLLWQPRLQEKEKEDLDSSVYAFHTLFLINTDGHWMRLGRRQVLVSHRWGCALARLRDPPGCPREVQHC